MAPVVEPKAELLICSGDRDKKIQTLMRSVSTSALEEVPPSLEIQKPRSVPPVLQSFTAESDKLLLVSQQSRGSFELRGRAEADLLVVAPSVEISRTRSENIDLLLKDSCPPYGFMSVIGRRREMEDTVAAVPAFYSDPPVAAVGESLPVFHFFAVYDGHGGAQASGFCKVRLHHLLAEEIKRGAGNAVAGGRRDPAEWEAAFKRSFRRVDIEVGGICPSGMCREDSGEQTAGGECAQCATLVAPENVGTTAVVGVVTPTQIVVANCGDSRAVLCRGGKAVPFSSDHKPQRDDELARIEAAGGRVIDWNGFRVGGFLAMSRAIGDRFLKQYVTSEPEVRCEDRSDEDECLILASDGLWDVLSNEQACNVARKCLAGYRPHRAKGILADGSAVAVATALLTKLALARGSHDNISVVVVDLVNNKGGRRGRELHCSSVASTSL